MARFNLVSRLLDWAARRISVQRRTFVPSDPTWHLARLTDGSDKFTDPYQQHEWCYACIKSIATNLSSVPLVIQTGSSETPRAVESGPLYDVLNRPNGLWCRWHLIEATVSWLQSCGNAIWVLKRNSEKQIPEEILVFGREGFDVVLNNNHIEYYTYRRDGNTVTLQPYEVVHFRLWNPASPVWGMGPLQAARISAESDFEASVYNRAFFRNSAMPGGLIQVPESSTLTEEGYKQMRERWQDMHQGSKRAFKLAVLEAGATFQQVSLSHRDMMFLEQKKWSREAVLACFRVPPTEIGVFDAVHKATAEDTRRAYWEQTLLPLARLIEDTLRAQFFMPLDGEKSWVIFDTTNVEALHDSLDKKIERALKLWSMAWSRNAINERLDLGMPDEPGGDVGFIGVGMIPISEALAPPPEMPEPEPPPTPEPMPMEEEPEEEEPPEEPEEEPESKSATPPVRTSVQHTEAQTHDWLHFDRTLRPSDRRFRETVGAYLARMRKFLAERLGKYATPTEVPDAAMLLSEKWDDELKKIANKHYRQVATIVKPQVEARIRRAGIDFTLDLADPRMVSYIDIKTLKIVEINDSIREGVRSALSDGVGENLTMGELQESIFAVMQDTRARALRIARTETTSAANGTEFVAHNIAGIKTHQWVASLDEATRETHLACMAEGPIPVGDVFSNGCRFPGDPSGAPGEVINCRCTLIPAE